MDRGREYADNDHDLPFQGWIPGYDPEAVGGMAPIDTPGDWDADSPTPLSTEDLGVADALPDPLLPEISEQRPAVQESYLAEIIDFLNLRSMLGVNEYPAEPHGREDPVLAVEVELAMGSAAALVGDLSDPNLINVMVAAGALVLSVPVGPVTAAFMAMKLLEGVH